MEEKTRMPPPGEETERRARRFAMRLTSQQLDRLRACASGISLRFDSPQIVDALIGSGYAERNIAGVVTVTAEGRLYLSSRTD